MKHIEPHSVHLVQMVNANTAKEIATEEKRCWCQCIQYTKLQRVQVKADCP